MVTTLMGRLFSHPRTAKRPAKRGKSAHSDTGNLPLGSTFTGTVRDLTAEGKGVVPHESGQVFFVPGVWLDEQLEIRVTGFKGRFGFGEIAKLLAASPHRVQPPCPYQGFSARDCGGCPWQFIDYQAQLSAKQKRVSQTLSKLVSTDDIKPILPSTQVFTYRNRAQLKTDGERLGYMAAASHNLVDIEDCLILTDKNRQTLKALREKLPNRTWRPASKKRLTSLDIDETVNADWVSVNNRLPFQQANSEQNNQMRKWLAGKLQQLDPAQPVLELFAGSGNFTEVIVKAGFKQITAVEVVSEAMNELHKNFPQVKTLVCDLFSASLSQHLIHALSDARILVLDPPRDGLKNDVLKSAQGLFRKTSKLREVFYISCNLATLSRDVEAFVAHGFTVKEVQPVDQFPHTPHIELMLHLTKS